MAMGDLDNDNYIDIITINNDRNEIDIHYYDGNTESFMEPFRIQF
jgi:hypothetical protein